MNHLPCRWFTWNVKSYFLWKITKLILECCPLQICSVLSELRWNKPKIKCQSLQMRVSREIIFFLFLHENICCGTHQKLLPEVLLMSTHNIYFCAEINKISIFLVWIKVPYLSIKWMTMIKLCLCSLISIYIFLHYNRILKHRPWTYCKNAYCKYV